MISMNISLQIPMTATTGRLATNIAHLLELADQGRNIIHYPV